PPRHGEGDRAQRGGGGPPPALRQARAPSVSRLRRLPPPRPGEDLFAPAPPLVADVGRAAALALGVLEAALLLRLRAFAALFDSLTAAIDRLELERTGQGIGFGEAQLERVADREALAGLLADQRAGALVEAVVVVADGRD